MDVSLRTVAMAAAVDPTMADAWEFHGMLGHGAKGRRVRGADRLTEGHAVAQRGIPRFPEAELSLRRAAGLRPVLGEAAQRVAVAMAHHGRSQHGELAVVGEG